jgi:hypothetical protein
MAKPISHEESWDPAARLARHHREIEYLKRRGAGPWHYVGDDTDETAPPFLNGWGNVGGSMTPLRYRHMLGGGVEIQGSVTGGAAGTAICQLPVGYRPYGGELRLHGSDDSGGLVVFRVLTNGDLIRL